MKVFEQTLTRRDLTHVIPRLIVIIVVGQTLPFKYFASEESVWIFTQMGWEPWGRYLIAIIETVAIILLISRWYIIGAIIILSIISAANFMHFTRLGINVHGDGGILFGLSIAVVICSLILVIHWNRIRIKNYNKHFEFPDISNEETRKS